MQLNTRKSFEKKKNLPSMYLQYTCLSIPTDGPQKPQLSRGINGPAAQKNTN